MTHVTCRLTAKNRDQLRNATLGNRVWASFFYCVSEKDSYIFRYNANIVNQSIYYKQKNETARYIAVKCMTYNYDSGGDKDKLTVR